MPTFGERLAEYARDMGYSKEEEGSQKTFAAFIGITDKAFSAYVTGGRTPTYKGLLEIRRQLVTSLDWITGTATHPKWGPEVDMLRLHLYKKAKEGAFKAPTMLDRTVLVLEETGKFNPCFKRAWFVAGMLGLPLEACETLRTRQGEVSAHSLTRLSQFTGLPEYWLMDGDEHDLTIPAGVGDYVSVALWLLDRGYSAQQVLPYLPSIERFLPRGAR